MAMKRNTIFLLLLLLFPISLFAQTKTTTIQPFTYSAWVAYWDKATSTSIVISNINKLDIVSPFSYTVEADGTIIDSMYLLKEPWTSLYSASLKSSKKTKIIPTIAWQKGSEIHATLSDVAKRKNHVNDILRLVERNNLAGIEIDYEGKIYETKDGFSAFLTELSTGLHKNNKILICDIEARTPPKDRIPNGTTTPLYVNDYKVIGKQCDEVRLMTYDQRDDDRTLNKTRSEFSYYAPVADPAWVEKVVTLAAKDIPKSKIIVGIPTYGNVFKIWLDNNKVQQISHVRSITYKEALKLASENGIYPARGQTGERTFHYTKDKVEYTVSFQDAESIRIKIALAKKLGVKGVALFKIDERADQDYWKYMK